MRIRLASVISLLMAAVLSLGSLFTSCAPEEKESQATKYLGKILEATFSGIEYVEPQVTTSKITFNKTPDLEIPHLNGAVLTLITGTNGESAMLADVTLDKGKVDLSVYNAGTTCIIGSSAIGKTMYGLELSDLGTLVGAFLPMQPSQFPEYGDSAVPGVGAAASGLIGMLSGIDSLLEDADTEKLYSLLEKYAKIIVDAAENSCESDVETADEITVTVEFNTDSAKKLIKDVFSALKDDKDVKSIVHGLLVSGGMSEADAKEQVSEMFSNASVKQVYDALDAAPFTLKTEVRANKDYVLNGVTLTIKSQGTTMKVFFNADEEGKFEIGVSSSVVFEGISYKQENKLVFESKTVDGAEIFRINLVTKENDAAQANLLFGTEVKDGKYTVTALIPSENEGSSYVTLKGETKTEGNKTTTTLTSVDAFDKTVSVDLKVETEVGGTLPTFPTEFKSIVEVTGDEFNAIMNNLKNSPLGQFIPEDGSEIVLPDVEY